MAKSTRKLVVPNGGWGWSVVFGVAVMNMFNLALVSVFTLIFGDEIENMGHGTSGAALVMNMMSATTNFSGLITGPAIKKFSYRKVAVTGSILTAIGVILSSQATEIWHLLVTFSILTGLGLGLISPSGFVAVDKYFTTKKSQAVGIAMAGTGLGQMLLPHVVRYLLDEYSYRAANLIFGALILNGVVGASLLQPVEWHMIEVESTEWDETLLLKKTQPLSITPKQSQSPVREPKPEAPSSIWGKISKVLDLKLLADGVFVNINLGISLVYTVSIFFSMLYPFFLQQGPAKLTRGQAASCMSALAGADMISRLTMPTIAQWIGFRARTTFFFGTLFLAMARSSIAIQDDYMMLLIVSGITGYIRAVTVVNINLTISEHVRQEQIPCALGLNMVTNGLILITGGQLLGWVEEYTHSFQLAIHTSSLMLLFVFVMWLPEMIWKLFKPKQAHQPAV